MLFESAAPAQPTPPSLLCRRPVYTFTGPNRSRGSPIGERPADPVGWRPGRAGHSIRGVGRLRRQRSYSRGIHGTNRGSISPGRDRAAGLTDSHVNLPELPPPGASLERVNLVGVQTEARRGRVAERERTTPKGEWMSRGLDWDEARGPTSTGTCGSSARAFGSSVILRRCIRLVGQPARVERAKITAATPSPTGGEIKKDRRGQPTGILVNNASSLLTAALPAPTPSQLSTRVLEALEALAAAGYVSVHEAGADAVLLATLDSNEDGR